jgi:hypothetical protein
LFPFNLSCLPGIVVLSDTCSSPSYDVPFPNANQSYYHPHGCPWNLAGDSLPVATPDVPLVYPPESETTISNHIEKYDRRACFYLRIFTEGRSDDARCLEDATYMFIGGVGDIGDGYDQVVPVRSNGRGSVSLSRGSLHICLRWRRSRK